MKEPEDMGKKELLTKKDRMSDQDYQFLLQTPFFAAIPEDARFHLMVAMKPVHLPSGERLIAQGDEGDSFYIIQNGSCSVSLEKAGIVRPLAVLGPGDLVGEMAILTGEHRNAHVDAQTDMDLWRLSRTAFEGICNQYPEIRHFLTQVVTDRFARATLTADRTVGKYVITEVLGRGGWSIVYKGVHTMLNMPVAIKMLKHNMAMDPDFLEKFQNEARVIANLNHENIVKVYDIEQLYRTVFIIMEQLEGVSLVEMLREVTRVPLPRALNILLQVCHGLGYAHEKGIIHGDVKPGNIFIQKNDKAKILDFGLARRPGTKGDRLVGTPRYFSPEQIRMGLLDERSDIYSLGISAYRIITGQEAFPDNDIANLLQCHLYEHIPDPRLVIPDLPDELHRFLVKSSEKDPTLRYQSMEEIIHDLQPLSRQLGVAPLAEPERHVNMMGLFLFYRSEHEEILKRLVGEFGQELRKIGAVLRDTDFKDI
ncbi:MAG: protein kinase [Desulfomonile tiedjei]|nr:protein kinase [Desulfomonile tiedjei]